MAEEYVISLADVEAAASRISGVVRTTPLLTCTAFDGWASAPVSSSGGGSGGSGDGSGGSTAGRRRVYFKAEPFQLSGSFKARGASNAVMWLTAEEAARGVCTHSSGNHAQALAAAAAVRGIPATIVMPRDAPAIKRAAVEGYGGRVVTCEPTQAAREAAAAAVAAETGARFVHPSEDPLVIAGQGTLALEMLAQVADAPRAAWEAGRPADAPAFDAVIVPVGGGGMISGVATALRGRDPRIRVFAAEPAAADDAARSKAAGAICKHATPPVTVADGLKTTLGPHTWPVVRDLVEDVITVPEAAIIAAMRLVYERLKVVIEPSAAVGVAALLSDEFRALPGITRVGVVLCGGNVDLDALPFLASRPPAA